MENTSFPKWMSSRNIYFVKIKLSFEESDSDRVPTVSSACILSQLAFFFSLFKNVLHEKIILIKCYFDIILFYTLNWREIKGK